MSRYIQHFLFLNIQALLLGWLVTNDTPERVYVSADAEPGVVIQSDCGRGCRFDGSGMETQHFWLPTGFFNGDITLKCRAVSSTVKLNAVRVWSRLIFERKWTDPNQLSLDSNGKLTLHSCDASFGLSHVGCLALLGGEIGILILSLLLLLLGKFFAERQTSRIYLCRTLIVAGALTIFCGLIVPLQTLLANHAELEISVWSTLLALSWRTLIAFIVLTLLLYWTTRFAGSLYLLSVSAFLVYEYLETGILTFGCSPLNGDMTFYKDVARMGWDALIFPATFLILFILCRFVPSTIVIVPAAVCLLGIASLCDVRSPVPDFHSDLGVKFKSKRQVVQEAVYSKNKNILTYVLDSAGTVYLQKLFRENPSFSAPLTGFTAYTNNLGMYANTVTGVAGMTTGRYYDDVTKSVEFMYSALSRSSFLPNFLEAHCPTFFNPGSFEVGISVGGATKEQIEESNHISSLDYRMAGQQPWSLMEIVRFRLAPFAGKYLDYIFTAGGWNISGDANNESWAYPILSKAPVLDVPSTFHWFHTMGMHGPYGVSRTGVDDGRITEGDAAKLNKLWFVWGQLIDLLQSLKDRGIYDKSMIVITADHGHITDDDRSYVGEASFLSANAWPILLVKPMFATGPLRLSNIPTSHRKIHDLILKAHDKQLAQEEIDGILRSDERYYSRPTPDKGGFENFYVDAKGNVSVKFQPSSGEDPLARPINLNQVYSLCGGNLNPPPIRFKRVFYFAANGPAQVGFPDNGNMSVGNESLFQFRTPAKHGKYIADIDLNANEDSEICDMNSTNRIRIPKSKSHVRHICHLDFQSDAKGLATMSFKSTEPMSIYSIKISEK